MANVLDQVRVKQGRLIRVKNTDRTFGSSDVYIAVQVEDADGTNERCLLFTEKELGPDFNPEEIVIREMQTFYL